MIQADRERSRLISGCIRKHGEVYEENDSRAQPGPGSRSRRAELRGPIYSEEGQAIRVRRWSVGSDGSDRNDRRRRALIERRASAVRDVQRRVLAPGGLGPFSRSCKQLGAGGGELHGTGLFRPPWPKFD